MHNNYYVQNFDREEFISTLMVILSTVIRKDIEELGVPLELHSNCLWGVKKYMRKVLYNLTNAELQEIRDMLREMGKFDLAKVHMQQGDFSVLLPSDLEDLIKSAIKGYMNYKRVKHK